MSLVLGVFWFTFVLLLMTLVLLTTDVLAGFDSMKILQEVLHQIPSGWTGNPFKNRLLPPEANHVRVLNSFHCDPSAIKV